MLGKLNVSFNSPQCGWMSIGFANVESEFNTIVANSPYENALPELLTAIADLVESNDFDYVLKWNRDPEEFDFRLSRKGIVTTIEIIEYPNEERENGEIVFVHKGDSFQTAKSFYTTFEQLFWERNIDEFINNWHHPFPYEEFKRLKELVCENSV